MLVCSICTDRTLSLKPSLQALPILMAEQNREGLELLAQQASPAHSALLLISSSFLLK